MTPVIPHLTNECFDKLNHNKKLDWPKVKEEYLGLNEKLIVIQINGKKRGIIKTSKQITENELFNLIKKITGNDSRQRKRSTTRVQCRL